MRQKTKSALRCLAPASLLLCALQAQAFSLEDVTARAKALMEQAYVAPASNLPPVFSQMQFADYQQIQPRPEKFEWRNLATPFKLAFYHQGMQFNTPVKINEIHGAQIDEIRYDPERFDFGSLAFDKNATAKLGYAGFRVLYPVNRKDKEDEIMSVLGASYFRVIGKNQVYGLSARALAIDTAVASGEEFPNFREFWIRRPAPKDEQLVIFALLDSPRATGAYQFTLRPGEDAMVDVQARIFLRNSVNTLGIAPLTSMFLFGPNQQSDRRNYRPALHDSNGLAIHAGNGEWLWRPLNNPQSLAVSAFRIDNPKGFGLLQRGREFSRFEDLKDRYDLRPSAWIEPKGDWGKGSVELVEIPSPDETNDNIVAFWRPDALPPKGSPLEFAYRMHWTMNEPALLGKEVAWVRQTFHTAGEFTQANLIRQLDGSTALLIDFEGPTLARLPHDAGVSAQISVDDNAELLSSSVQPNSAIQGWRLTLRVKVKDPRKPVEMRAALVRNGKALSETWSYQLPPHTEVARQN
ncbi:glucan biosynthesis protein G [Herbaspirillum sp. RV1423]|uniref:glucan biosynthesis protein G n=1 Tax=Herbaspirillum sp. RV1423 TaxID=1443993 RepID=UPI001E55DC1E|nr:glucan biosynthesis protein G [Herbaspirillum sp. RV1423]